MPRAYKALPPASELWERFDYKPLTGELVNKTAAVTRPDLFNKRADFPGAQKYRCVHWKGSMLYAHRVIWAWVYGDSQVPQLDHKNENKQDNRWGNLRPATQSQNMSNRKATKGVYQVPSGRYQSKIVKDYKVYRLGTYDTEAEARAAYEKASLELHGEFSAVG